MELIITDINDKVCSCVDTEETYLFHYNKHGLVTHLTLRCSKCGKDLW